MQGYFICLFVTAYDDTITVHAPHPPEPHPSFVPGRPTEQNEFKAHNNEYFRELIIGVES